MSNLYLYLTYQMQGKLLEESRLECHEGDSIPRAYIYVCD